MARFVSKLLPHASAGSEVSTALIPEIALTLDRSGSMQPNRLAAVQGANTFLATQQKLQLPARFTFTTFSNLVSVIHDAVPIHCAHLLSPQQFAPLGPTALCDAIGDLIDRVGQRFDLTEHSDSPAKPRVLIAILTDGQENASTQWTQFKLQELIIFRQSVHHWQFLFIGPDDESALFARSIGIPADHITTFDPHNPQLLQNALSRLTIATTAFLTNDADFAKLLQLPP
jgi:uncharacterized protein YegL